MKLLRQNQVDVEAQRIAVVGTFDGVHRGHRFLLDFMMLQAQQRYLEPTVITFSQHPLTVIRPHNVPKQLTTIDERINMLQECGVESCIMLDFDDELRRQSARQFLEMILHDYEVKVLVIGFNTRFGCDCIDSFDEYKKLGNEIGVEVIQAPEYGSGICSSAIRKMLRSSNIFEANNALGYCYSIAGKVVKGKQLGRTIGFPTANIEIADDKKLIPPLGVYAVEVYIPHLGKTYRGMLNIGRRPTVDVANAPITIEVHIIDFEGDIYGEEVNVKFIKQIREERQFPSLDDLIEQLSLDRQEAMKDIELC